MSTPNASAPLPSSWVNTSSAGSMLSVDDAAMPVEFLALRAVVALAYGLVGAIGLLGNLAVLWVLGNCTQRAPCPPSDTFVFNLALQTWGWHLLSPSGWLNRHWTSTGPLEVPSARRS